MNEFHAYKSHVIDALSRSPSKVHIAFDGWTSRNRHSFFSINAFFLDEKTFQPRKIFLGLPTISVSHTGDSFEDLDPDDFDEWTKAGPVDKLHNLVVWLHRSNQATAMLRRLQEEYLDKAYPGALDVVLDNSRRWLSEYYMIKRAIKLTRYLEELIDITVQSSKKLTRSRSKPTQRRNSLPKCLDEGDLRTRTGTLLAGFRIFLPCLTPVSYDSTETARSEFVKEWLRRSTASYGK
ncbi:transposase [Metarhizium brunneum]